MTREAEDCRAETVIIIDYLFLQDGFRQFAGPGHWNDPDMLIVGNHWPKPKLPGLSVDQVFALLIYIFFKSLEFELIRGGYVRKDTFFILFYFSSQGISFGINTKV